MNLIPKIDDFCKVNWDVAFKTYGNNHATLIGLLIAWWIGLCPTDHEALDGGISIAMQDEDGAPRRHCDGMLLSEKCGVGVLEVEGTRWEKTLKKIYAFLTSDDPKFEGLKFGIFLAYQTTAQGRGASRQVPQISDQVCRWVENPSLPPLPEGKQIFILGLEKKWDTDAHGIRAKAGNDYYRCSPDHVWIRQISGKKMTKPVTLVPLQK